MQRPYLEKIAFEETSSEADSLGSMDDDLMLEEGVEQPQSEKDSSSSTASELARSETKYFDAGSSFSARPPNMQLL